MRVEVRRLVGLMIILSLSVATATTPDMRLIKAAKNQDRQTVRALLKEKVDVNTRQPDGATPLHWAAYRDDLETADLLLRAGAAVHAVNDLGVTPLYLACDNGSAAKVQKLLAAGASPNAALPSGETALMTAVRAGSVPAVKALLIRGADVNAREATEGQTALMWAVSQQHAAIVEVLIEAKADVKARSNVRPVMTSRGGRGDGAKGIIEEGGYTALLFAARQGDLASARLLLTAGANVNDTAPLGTSALLVAAQSGHGELAAFLLDKGADPNAAAAGYTPLHAAVLRSDLDLAKALVARGAKLDAPITNGSPVVRQGKQFTLAATLVGATPFFLASKFADVRIMRFLADVGADTQLGLKDGTTPVMVAAGMRTGGLGRGGTDRWDRELDSGEVEFALTQNDDQRRIMGSGLEAVKLAVELGGDVNAANNVGDTALHYAAFHGFKSVIQFLVNKGADVNVKNKRGETPLMVAMREGAPAQMTPDLGRPDNRTTELLLRKLGAKDMTPDGKLPPPRRDEEGSRPPVKVAPPR